MVRMETNMRLQCLPRSKIRSKSHAPKQALPRRLNNRYRLGRWSPL